MKKQLSLYLVMLPVILLAGGPLSAQTLTWDPALNGTGSYGTGTWAPSGTGTPDWSNGTTDVTWLDGDAAVFGGTQLGTADVNLTGTVTASAVNINTSGYDITASSTSDELVLSSGPAADITVAANVTAEIDAQFSVGATSTQDPHIDVGNGGTLTFTGGIGEDGEISTLGKSLFTNYGDGNTGTIVMDASSSATATSPTIYNPNNFFTGTGTIIQGNNTAVVDGSTNQNDVGGNFGQGINSDTGTGTYEMNGANSLFRSFNISLGQGHTYTFDIKAGNFASDNNTNLGTGNSGTAQTDTFLVEGGQALFQNNLTMVSDAGTNMNAVFTSTGGTTVFKGGILMNFGNGSSAAPSSASSTINISGGNVYIGSTGITNGNPANSAPTTAAYAINLSGGTIGATASWSSSLNMTLTNTVTFQTSDAGATINPTNFSGINGGNGQTYTASGAAQTITLGGILSGHGSLTASGGGVLVTSGANTYSGGTSVINGTQLHLNSAGTGNVHVDANFSDLQLNLSTAIASTATLTLDSATASEVDLDFSLTGTDVIGALDINGTSIAAGTYTAAELDAMTVGGVPVTDFTDNSGGLNSLTIGVVPEPSTWTLLLGGLGLVGLVARRRHAANQI